jgi:hypothetical protein
MGWMTQFQGDAVRYMSVDFRFRVAWSTDSHGQNGNGNGLLAVFVRHLPAELRFQES